MRLTRFAVFLLLCFLVERVAGIVGGSLVEYPRKYPFMAALVDDSGKLTCGATLITHNWLVTSARCVVNVDTLEMLPNPRVILGAHNFSSPLDVEVIVHPYFHPTRFANDVALIRVEDVAAEQFQTASLASVGDTVSYAPGAQAIVIGWGRTSETGAPSTTLLQAQVGLVSQATCAAAVTTRPLFLQACAGGSGKDFCSQDTGGPLLSSAVANNTLIGIASWQIGCARSGIPSVYTDIRSYRPWIDSIIVSTGIGICPCPCAICPSVEWPKGIPCTLSVAEETCALAHCFGNCILGQLGDGTCQPRCNTSSCDFDKHDCPHNVTVLQDPSIEGNAGAWEVFNEGAFPVIGSLSCCNTSSTLRARCRAIDGSYFMCFNAFSILLTSDSWVSQRPRFPTGKALLTFYLLTNCNPLKITDFFEVRIDSVLAFSVNYDSCWMYSSNWTWVSIDVTKWADGKEHDISFSAHIGPNSIPSIFEVDVVRFITNSDDPLFDSLTGPCEDKSFPRITENSTVCQWYNVSCCATPEKVSAVQQIIDAATRISCPIVEACKDIIGALQCTHCTIQNASFWEGDKLKICQPLADVVYYLCRTSKWPVGDQCITVGKQFKTAADFVNSSLGIYSDSTTGCYEFDPAAVIGTSSETFHSPPRIDSDIKKTPTAVFPSDGGLSTGTIIAIVVPTGVLLIAGLVAVAAVMYLIWRKNQEPEDVSKAEAAFRDGYRGHQTAAGKPVIRYKRQKTPKRIAKKEGGTEKSPREAKPHHKEQHHHPHESPETPKAAEVEAELPHDSAAVEMSAPVSFLPTAPSGPAPKPQ